MSDVIIFLYRYDIKREKIFLKKSVETMTFSTESMYWRKNEEWFTTDENGKFHLTDKAPERARESFMLYNTPRNERNASKEEVEALTQKYNQKYWQAFHDLSL